jgi:FkbM family methyltransferase
MEQSMSLYEKAHFLHRCYRYRFRTERQQLAKLLTFDLEGAVVFDIGGNHGIYTYWLSKAVGPKGQVHVFEPQPELITELNGVKQWLNMHQAKINGIALSDERATKTLSRTRIGDGSATLNSRDAFPNSWQEISVETICLDDYCEMQAPSNIRYIKIDVEGHELSVIRGGLKSISSFQPIIQIELRVHEKSCDEIITILSNIGYQGFMYCNGQEIPIANYKQVPSAKFGFEGHRDFIFQPSR